jgi:rhamnose transport system substrate-binding protein
VDDNQSQTPGTSDQPTPGISLPGNPDNNGFVTPGVLPPTTPKSNKRLWILVAAALVVIVGVGVWLMVVKKDGQNSSKSSSSTTASQTEPQVVKKHTLNTPLKIGMLPKLKGIAYFDSVAKGAQDAAKELGVTVDYDGPIQGNADLQIPFIKKWISENFDVIAVSSNDPAKLAPALKEARSQGIKVVSFDADTLPEARDFFVNQATYDGVGFTLVDKLVEETGANASIGVLTASLTDKNQNQWLESIKRRIADKYPNIKIVAILPGQHDAEIAYSNTKKMLELYPEIKGIIAPESTAFPAAAKVVSDLNKKGQVAVVGLTTPLSIKDYIKSGVVKSSVLWKTEDLGYLTIYVSKAAATGTLKKGDKSLDAGKLGDKAVTGSEVLLGDPFVFTKDNIDSFNF